MVTIPQSILDELKKIAGVQGYLLTGSRVLGKNSKNADWDIFVILQSGKKSWRKTYQIGTEWLELICNSTEQIKKEFKEDLEEGRGITTYMFATAQIILDSKNKSLFKLVSLAKRLWKKGPTYLSQQQKAWISYDIANYLQDLEDCLLDNNDASLIMSQAINEFVRYYYRLSNIWLPRIKDREIDLSNRSRDLFDLIKKHNKTADWRKRTEILIEFGERLGEKFQLDLRGNLYVRLTNK